MVGFRDFDGVGIAPVSKKMAVKIAQISCIEKPIFLFRLCNAGHGELTIVL